MSYPVISIKAPNLAASLCDSQALKSIKCAQLVTTMTQLSQDFTEPVKFFFQFC